MEVEENYLYQKLFMEDLNYSEDEADDVTQAEEELSGTESETTDSDSEFGDDDDKPVNQNDVNWWKIVENLPRRESTIEVETLDLIDDSFSSSYSNSKTEMLFVELELNYTEGNLDFKQLGDEDQLVARLLQSQPFLDVHLAVVTIVKSSKLNNSTEQQSTMSFEIAHLIDCNNKPLHFKGTKINYFQQMVGNPSLSLKAVKVQVDGDQMKRYYNHPALVIWPKQETDAIYCKYGLLSLLQSIETKLGSSSKLSILRHVPNRVDLIEDLRFALEYCQKQPLVTLVGSIPNGRGKSETILRLLKLCIRLQAREEGLSLLELLSTSFHPQIEGVCDEKVAKSIANFVSTGRYNIHSI